MKNDTLHISKKEIIELVEWLRQVPTAKQFYVLPVEDLLRYYKEQNQPSWMDKFNLSDFGKAVKL